MAAEEPKARFGVEAPEAGVEDDGPLSLRKKLDSEVVAGPEGAGSGLAAASDEKAEGSGSEPGV